MTAYDNDQRKKSNNFSNGGIAKWCMNTLFLMCLVSMMVLAHFVLIEDGLGMGDGLLGDFYQQAASILFYMISFILVFIMIRHLLKQLAE